MTGAPKTGITILDKILPVWGHILTNETIRTNCSVLFLGIELAVSFVKYRERLGFRQTYTLFIVIKNVDENI